MLYFTFTSIGFLIIYRVLMVDFLSILITTILNRLCWKGICTDWYLLSGNHTSTQYVGKDKKGAVVFAFDIYSRYGEKLLPVRLQGLDAGRQYRVKEINLMPGANSSLQGNGELFSGEYLMTVGLNIFTGQRLNSRVIEVVAE